MMSAILDALSYLGSSLDKPGRAVRGLLGGRPEEALSAIPFSDAMGLTNQDNAVSGRALLEKLGVLGDNQEGFDFGDVAGAGVEMALDPLTWLGGAAISRLKPRPGLPGAGVKIRPSPPRDMGLATKLDGLGTSLEAVDRSGNPVGGIHIGPSASMEKSSAVRGWPGVVKHDDTVGRVFGADLDPAYHGLGIGQQMYLDAMNKSPVNWMYNSGNSEQATQAIEAMRSKGLAEVHWDPLLEKRGRHLGGPRIMRITPEGRVAAEAGSVLKPGPGLPPNYSPLIAALMGEQTLARGR